VIAGVKCIPRMQNFTALFTERESTLPQAP
jgi:hypothetical protein